MVDEGMAREVINRIQKLRKKVVILRTGCCLGLLFWYWGGQESWVILNTSNELLIISP